MERQIGTHLFVAILVGESTIDLSLSSTALCLYSLPGTVPSKCSLHPREKGDLKDVAARLQRDPDNGVSQAFKGSQILRDGRSTG